MGLSCGRTTKARLYARSSLARRYFSRSIPVVDHGPTQQAHQPPAFRHVAEGIEISLANPVQNPVKQRIGRRLGSVKIITGLGLIEDRTHLRQDYPVQADRAARPGYLDRGGRARPPLAPALSRLPRTGPELRHIESGR